MLALLRRRAPWTIGALCVVALIVLSLTMYWVRDTGANAATASPRSTVNTWLHAARDGDLAALRSMSCSSLAGEIARHPDSYRNDRSLKLSSWNISKTTQHGDQADVELYIHYTFGNGAWGTFETAKIGGKWKVCQLAGFAQ